MIALAKQSDIVLVVGSENSSNTRALVRVARSHGTAAHRVDSPDAIEPDWLEGAAVVGVTAGASAPDASVAAVIAALGATQGVEVLSVTTEGEYFPPPPRLRSFLQALQSAVEGSVAARRPGQPGLLDEDRSWDATHALEMLEAG